MSQVDTITGIEGDNQEKQIVIGDLKGDPADTFEMTVNVDGQTFTFPPMVANSDVATDIPGSIINNLIH